MSQNLLEFGLVIRDVIQLIKQTFLHLFKLCQAQFMENRCE